MKRVIISAIIVLIVIGVALAWLYISHAPSARVTNVQTNPAADTPTMSATVYSQFAPPTPGSERTTYVNHKYGYSFVYPSQWHLKIYTFQNVDVVQGRYQIQVGVDGYPFDLNCQANPKGLDAQAWFIQQFGNAGTGTEVGYMTLKSGVIAFLGVAHGQVDAKEYTFTHNQFVCSFGIVIANDANNIVTDAIVNSIKWL